MDALKWRIETSRMWSPGAAEAYGSGPLNSSDAKANAAHNRNRMAAKARHDLIFPKDD